MQKILAYIKLVRPKQYIKNLLVFAPLFFTGDFFKPDMILECVKLFLAFSFLASSIYVVNDITDRKKDKLHPQKKNRPIAAGKISVKNAVITGILFFILSGILSISLPLSVIAIFGLYVAANLLYSFWLKNVVIVDIFVVASMYLMRIHAGGELLNITLSHWIILCTFFLALFFVTAKRRAEFVSLGDKSHTRAVLNDYSKEFLDAVLIITTTSCMVTYGLYAVSIPNPYLIYSLFFVAFSMLRYLYLVYMKDYGQSPEGTLQDHWIKIGVIGWILYNCIAIYFN